LVHSVSESRNRTDLVKKKKRKKKKKPYNFKILHFKGEKSKSEKHIGHDRSKAQHQTNKWVGERLKWCPLDLLPGLCFETRPEAYLNNGNVQ